MSLREDRDWATNIYQERAELVDVDEDVTCFFLESYSEICRYMRVIGYGSKGKAESVEEQVARGLALGRVLLASNDGPRKTIYSGYRSFYLLRS